MHYTKSIISYESIGWKNNVAKYKTLCGETVITPKTNRKFKATTCVKCLQILLIRKNDELAKIAERLVQVENTPVIVIPKLPERPSFLVL